MKYYSRGVRRRGDSDQWEVRLMHKDAFTGEEVFTYHTVTAKTKKQAEKRRDELIMDLQLKGGAMHSRLTVGEFMTSFVDYKEKCGVVEPSTIRGYRGEVKQISKYLGEEPLSDLTIAKVNDWMAQMTAEGYAPKTVAKPFRLLKQALNYAIAQDLLTKNPCDYCKPPKRVKTPINALSREERSRMLDLAWSAQPAALAVAIELALTTGMRRGEVCALRWSDFHDDGTITVTHALGNGAGGFYEKEPKTSGSARTIPLTRHTFSVLKALRDDSRRLLARLGIYNADPYILGTQEDESRPYNPTQLGKDFAAFCKMHSFDCTFHDLRHTFATYMIGSGVDVCTVASYLGHSSVSMTLDIYADVDPDAKFSAVRKIEEAFDDRNRAALDQLEKDGRLPKYGRGAEHYTLSNQDIPFSEEELEDMLFRLRAQKQKERVGSL